MLNSQLILNQSIIDDEWTFVALPSPEESFIDTVRRIGVNPFKEHVYA